MPQMAPLNWLSLFMLFNIVFIIFIIMNYYSFLYKPKMPTKVSKKTKSNWKW